MWLARLILAIGIPIIAVCSFSASDAFLHRSVAGFAFPVYNVTAYGAVCDNVTDDAAAINTAIAAVRATNANAYGAGAATLYFPPSQKCLIKSTLNFTNLRFQGLQVTGGFIDCQTTSTPCIDASGSAFVDWSNMEIIGNGTANIGFQIWAPNNGGGAQLQHFTNVIVNGTFSLAAFYNLGAEAAVFLNCAFINVSASSSAYALIQDGYNHFGVTSAFTTTTIGTDAGTTFDHDVFIGAQIQNTGGGSALWIGNAAHHEFTGYIAVAAVVPAVIVFTETAAGGLGNVGLKFNTHMESVQSSNFKFMSAGTLHTPVILGFEYNDLLDQAATSTLSLDSSVTGLTINDMNIHIWKNNVASIPLFDTAASYTIHGGYVYLPASADWTSPAAMTGILCKVGTCTYN